MKIKSSLITIVMLFAIGIPGVSIAEITDSEFKDTLKRLRESRQEFKNEREKESSETREINKAQRQIDREAAQQRREEARAEMEAKRKEVLLKSVDLQIAWFERVKERVEKMPNINNDLKTRLVEEVNLAISDLVAKKTSIQGAAGKEAIKTLAKEIKELFKVKHEAVKNIVDAIHASRTSDTVTKAEDRAAVIKARLEEMKSDGKNVAELEALLVLAQEDILNAQNAAGQNKFKEANEALKDAYQKFREISQKAKELE